MACTMMALQQPKAPAGSWVKTPAGWRSTGGGAGPRANTAGSRVVASAAKPRSSPPVMAASVVLAPEEAGQRAGSAWLTNPTYSPAGVELAKWADGLIQAYRANNSKLASGMATIAQSGLSQLEAWRQRLDELEGPHARQSLLEMHDAQQGMLRQLADLEQQLAAAAAAEEAELQRGVAATTAAAGLSVNPMASVAATVAVTLPMAATTTSAVGPAATSTATPALAVVAEDDGVHLTAWADDVITRNLGASRILRSSALRQARPSTRATAATAAAHVDLAKVAAGEAALAARGIQVHAGDAAAAAAALQQLQVKWERELQAFQVESDSMVRQLGQLQQQHLAHMHALSGTSAGALSADLGTWEVQWSKVHAEIRTLAAATAGTPRRAQTATRRTPAAATFMAVPLPAASAAQAAWTGSSLPPTAVPAVATRAAAPTATSQPAAAPASQPLPLQQQQAVAPAVVASAAATAPPTAVSEGLAVERQVPHTQLVSGTAANQVPFSPSVHEGAPSSPRSKPASWDVFGQLLHLALRAEGKA